MARARARRAGAENLDSLLDTMANVTGILVVMLAVTQISVGDAMERLRGQMAERPELTRESLAMAQAEVEALREALAPLAPRADALEGMRRGRRDELAALRAANAKARDAVEAAKLGEAEDIERRIAEGRYQENALRAQLEGTRAEIARVEAELAAPPPGQSPIVARLPDPRPPPAGATDAVFMCRYGRCFRADARLLMDALTEGVRRATGGRWHLYSSSQPLVDRGQVVAYFRSNDVGSANLRWHVLDLEPGEFVAQLEWRSQSIGETADQLERPGSAYRATLRQLSRRRNYLRFFVWDDSFEAYQVARQLASDMGYAAGWQPQSQDAPFRQDLLRSGFSPMVD